MIENENNKNECGEGIHHEDIRPDGVDHESADRESADHESADREDTVSKETNPEDTQDTKAFNWEWTDGEADPDSSDGASEPVQEDVKEEDILEEGVQEDVQDEPVMDEACECTPDPADEKSSNKKAKKVKLLPLSCILSACSIILLVAFALSLMFGIFPISGHRVIYLGVSDLGQTKPDSEASSELLEDFLNSVVVVTARTEASISTGTGVIISSDGYIVTNYHVIEDTDTISIQLYGEDISVKAEVRGYHEEDDVAVLKIDRKGLRAAPFAKTSDVRYGEKVYAVGNPEGVEFSWSITQGIVSSPLRQLMIYNSEGILEKKMNVVQTDASVNHGNSGGPLINVRGEIVGIVTLKRTDSAGMGFALPADGVLADVTSIIEHGHADNASSGISMPRPLLGITGVGVKAKTYYKNIITNGQRGIEVVDAAYARANPATTFYAAITGVHVSEVSPGSDAANHLKEDDIITEVNGKPVTTIYDVMDIVNEFNGGDKVTVKYYRNGKYKTVELTLKTSKELD